MFETMQEVVEHYESQADAIAEQRKRNAQHKAVLDAMVAFGNLTDETLALSDHMVAELERERSSKFSFDNSETVVTFAEEVTTWDSEVARSISEQSLPVGYNGPHFNGICRKPNCKCKNRPVVADFVRTRKHDNGVDCFDIAVEGNEALVFSQENGSGKLVRYWIDRDTNVSARIRYVNTPSNPASWRLEVYLNQREGAGFSWVGGKIATHHVHRTVTNESELTVAKYVALYFAKYAPKPLTQEERDEKLLAAAWKSATAKF